MTEFDPSHEATRGPEALRYRDENRGILALVVDSGLRIHRAAGTAVDEVLDETAPVALGGSLLEYLHPEYHDRLLEASETAEDGDTVSLDDAVPVRGGTGLWSHTSITVRRLVGMDSSDRLLVILRPAGKTDGRDDHLRPTREQRELALEGANLGIWDWDMRADRVERDELLTKMLGYTPEEMGTDLSDWERLVHPTGERRHNEALAEHVEKDTPYYDCEYRMRTETGDWKWVRTIGRVVEWSEDGEPLRAVGIHQDIDDRKRAELALQEERDLFRKGPAIVFQWVDKPGWPITYVSENVGDILGYSPGELRQKPFAELVHEDDLAELEAEIAERTETGDRQLNPSPYRVYTADGDLRWVMEFTKPLSDSDEVTTLLGYLVDITDRKRQEQKYRNLFESARDAVMVFDRESYLDYNQRALELFGYESGAAFLDTNPWERSPPTQPDGRNSKEKALEHIERAFEEGEAFFEWTHQRADGSTFPSEVKLSKFSVDGKPALHALVRDITERKAYESELEELNRRFELALEETQTRILEWDLETDAILWDEAGRRLLGGDGESVPKSFEGFIEQVHDGDVAELRRAIDRAIQTDEEIRADFRVESAGPGWRWLQIRGGVLYDAGSRPRRIIAVLSDITDRKRREQAVERERELNRRVQQALAESQTRTDLEDLITDQLSEHGYALAWIGEAVEGEMVPRSVGGGRRYLQGLDRSLAGGSEPAPSVEAARAGTAQFYQWLPEQDTDWSETATRYNYRSAAAVPLVYRDVSYGILALYHEDPDWFDESERALIGELSETLAFAIHSLETQ
ncbi:MAG: PAS domain S-box protein, partial [Halodesulfurarchaeum sp.]